MIRRLLAATVLAAATILPVTAPADASVCTPTTPTTRIYTDPPRTWLMTVVTRDACGFTTVDQYVRHSFPPHLDCVVAPNVTKVEYSGARHRTISVHWLACWEGNDMLVQVVYGPWS